MSDTPFSLTDDSSFELLRRDPASWADHITTGAQLAVVAAKDPDAVVAQRLHIRHAYTMAAAEAVAPSWFAFRLALGLAALLTLACLALLKGGSL